MKKELLAYLAGLCQAASAALLASAIIMPESRFESLLGCYAAAVIGGVLVVLKSEDENP